MYEEEQRSNFGSLGHDTVGPVPDGRFHPDLEQLEIRKDLSEPGGSNENSNLVRTSDKHFKL